MSAQRKVPAIWLAMMVLATACTSITGGDDASSASTTLPFGGSPVETITGPPGATISMAMMSPEAISAHHAITPGALDIAALLHTGLTLRGANGLAVPGLAESWTTLDQRTWVFKLRPGATFNDGSPITATSFLDSWQTLATQSTRSRNAYLGLSGRISGWDEVLSGEDGRLIGVRAIDEVTLQVQLDEPFPFFPELVSHPAFAPVAAAELSDPNPLAPIGTGPFRIEEPWVPGERLRIARVSGGGLSGTVAAFDIRFVTSGAEAARLVEAGEVDFAPIGNAADPGDNTTVIATATDTLIYMGFPVSREPVDEPHIRQALAAAIDRPRIERDLVGDSSLPNAAYAPLSAAGANLLTCTACVYDGARARQLLVDGEVETPENSLSLHVVEGSAGEVWADAIALGWRIELGWPVTVVRHDLAGLVGFLQAGIPDGPFILEWTSEYPAAESWLIPLFNRSGFDDFTRFSDRDITRAFEELEAMPSGSANRTTPLKDIREVLGERVPIIPLGVTTRRIAVGPAINADTLGAGQHLGLDALTWRP